MDCDCGIGWTSVSIAIVTGLLASGAWALGRAGIYRCCVWRRYRNVGGTYREERKFPLATPETNYLTIKRNKDVLVVDFDELPGRSIHGRIVMNRHLASSGEGHYDHLQDKQQLWGFWNVQLNEDGSFLVHTTYASDEDTLVLQGYIWTPVAARHDI